MLVMVVFFIAFRWIHLSTPLIRLFLLVLILLLMPTLNFLPVWFALSLLRFRLPSRLPMMFILWMAFHDETGRLNVDGMNIISNDGSNKLNRSRKARVSYKVQRTINASLNAATSTRAVSSNPNFVTRQKIEIIFG